MRVRAILFVVSSAVSLLAAESAARSLGLSKTWSSYTAEPELNLHDLVTSEPIGFTRHPLTAWKMPRGFTFRSNAEGFRDKPFTLNRDPTLVRVAFLGDSVTEGYGVEESDRFSNVVVAILNHRAARQYEAFNFGVVGQSTADEYVVLTRHALRFKPDIVVLQVDWNDFAENARKLPALQGTSVASAITTFGERPPRSHGWNGFLQGHSALYLAVAERLSTYRLKRGRVNSMLDAIHRTRAEEWTATEELLMMFSDACRTAGIQPLAAYFPMDVEVQTADEHQAQFTAARIASLAAHSGMGVIDILTPLRRRRGSDLYLDDIHLTATGHKIVAEAIATMLRQRASIPAPQQAQ
jgi:lysophospholipase L1-like esterase